MTRTLRSVAITLPLVIGGGLLVATIAQTDLDPIGQLGRQLGIALPLLLLPSAAWHLLRTAAWRQCFPPLSQPSFGRTFRVRLAAEAFSWVTIRGVAGEPLKVALLDREMHPTLAASAVALERIAYIMTTACILALSAATALATLPLTTMWRRIFIGIAVGGASVVGGTLLLLLRRPPPPIPGAAQRRRSATARFLVAMAEHVRRAVHEKPRRLITLAALESAAYAMMALEVWIVFRLVQIPVTLNAAFAVETFTRIASMASAFIPANLGALEASNVAAANAVHAAGGAAALALARRVRGLFWCAGGFLIYPRSRPRAVTATNGTNDAMVILEDADSEVLVSDRLGGMPIGERLLRSAARAGCAQVLVWAPRQKPIWEAIVRRTAWPLEVSIAAEQSIWSLHLDGLDPQTRPVVVAPAVVPLPQLMAAARGGLVHSDVMRRDIDELRSPVALSARLKTAQSGIVGPARDAADGGGALLSLRTNTVGDLRVAERRLRNSIFKPTDGPLGRLNRRISIPISIGLIRTMRLSAHAMTAFVLAASLYAGWLFSRGSYIDGVMAALVSWAASVLDGCDGELARLQHTDSALGCWFDTLADYAYYIAVFVGLVLGVAQRTNGPAFWWIGSALLIGVVLTLTLLILLRGRITGGHPERLRTTASAHFETAGKRWAIWAAWLSMCATRATMPYGLLVFAVLNLLPGFVILAAIGANVYWISLALQLKSLLNPPRGIAGQSSEVACG
jgi:phosphatidylglycerophosphate synthase